MSFVVQVAPVNFVNKQICLAISLSCVIPVQLAYYSDSIDPVLRV